MSGVPPIETRVRRAVGAHAEPTPFGAVQWAVRQDDPAGAELTVGLATFEAGSANERHLHPNCEEVLYVLAGEVTHTLGDERTVLHAGDLIVVPRGAAHQVLNTGSLPARCLVVFSSPDRQFLPLD